MIINLVMNACQALPDSSKAVRISIGKGTDNDDVFVEIQDEGIGIPSEALQQIKDPFFTTKLDGSGTGLGLAISERIVLDHEGKMTFTSEHGLGTCVRVIFPVSDDSV